MAVGYWAKRQAKAQAALTSKNIEEVEKQLIRYYQRTARSVIKEFESTYDKLLVTVGAGKDPTPADLYKLDKYWQLQGQIKQELQALGDKQYNLFFDKFVKHYSQIYEAIALKDDLYFRELDRAAAIQMINEIWCADGKSWSQRIWTNTDKLQQSLNDNLIDCVVTGKKTTQLKNLRQEQFNASYNRADTIIRTEMAHIQTQAAQKRYADYGITQVEVLVDEDERTCEVCADHEGERYPIGAQMPVPFHPRCRCCIVPVVEID